MCTNFKVLAKQNDALTGVAIGRSQEFGIEMSTALFFRNKGHQFTQQITPPLSDLIPNNILSEIEDTFKLQWVGRYGYVALNSQDFIDAATDGMNTQGLYVGSLLLNETSLPQVTDPQKGLFAVNFADWVLSLFATCEDVCSALNNNEVQVSAPYIKNVKFNQHYAIHDAKGNSIVIEFIDGKVNIHDNNRFGVLTNDPAFDWQQTNMRNYVAVTPVVTPTAFAGNFSCPVTNKSEGSGFSGLPGGILPPHRFVRAATMVNYASEVTTPEQASNLAFHILNTVDIPVGVVKKRGSDGQAKNSDHTLYVTVSDLTQKIYSVRLYDSALVYSVNLADLEEKGQLAALDGNYYQIPRQQQSIDITSDIVDNKIEPLPMENGTESANDVVHSLYKVFDAG